MKNAATSIFLLLVWATTAVSCQLDVKGIRGSGKVTTEDRNITEPFTGIDASSGIEVMVSQGSQKVTVQADDNLQKHILTRVQNGVLKISSEYNSYIDVKSRKVIVSLPTIDRIETSGGASLWSTSGLKGAKIETRASGGSEMKLELEADHFECRASSGSDVELKGKALTLDTESSSGSSLDASKLMANDITSKSSSGSSTTVHPLVSLSAKASSGGSIEYTHEPKYAVKSNSSSGGSVSKI